MHVVVFKDEGAAVRPFHGTANDGALVVPRDNADRPKRIFPEERVQSPEAMLDVLIRLVSFGRDLKIQENDIRGGTSSPFPVPPWRSPHAPS
jgi:hypothetical protein